MPGTRFLKVELTYGCHVEGSIEIPDKAGPVVIGGPNGSRKTTFLEALVRTLFGFNRMQDEERRCLEARVPWTSEACVAVVEIAGGDGERVIVQRDFHKSTVRIDEVDGGETWIGDGNPASRNQEAREYRQRLAELFGFSAVEHYEQTACITHGGLVGTRLGEDLLQIAAGGYGGVDEALGRLKDQHREITKRPITLDIRGGNNPRALEQIEREIADIRVRLENAEAAFRRRTPILKELDETQSASEQHDREIDRFELALSPLSERKTIQERIERLTERLRTLRRTVDRVDKALRAVEDTTRQAESTGDPYPDDFLERTGRLESLWSRRVTLVTERESLDTSLQGSSIPSPWTATLAGVVLALLGAILIATEAPLWTGISLMIAGAVLAALLLLRRSQSSREVDRGRDRMREIAEEIVSINEGITRELEGVPRSASVTPDLLEDRKREFLAWRGSRERLENAHQELERAVEDALETLGDTAPTDLEDTPMADALRVREACETEREETRKALARAEIELDKVAAVDLPDRVEPTLPAVRRALEELRKRRDKLGEEVMNLQTRLLREGSGGESPVALRDRIDELNERRAELDREATAHEAAYALIRDSSERFRERDQERFVETISEALSGFGQGTLGPLEVTDDLSKPRIHLHGRSVPLTTPPLSYGEYHAALFAIRLGSSDFLARAGVRPPLIVDEPFAYLDLDRAREMWTLLLRIARDRQVFVATQERLTLEALEIEPDLVFERPLGI